MIDSVAGIRPERGFNPHGHIGSDDGFTEPLPHRQPHDWKTNKDNHPVLISDSMPVPMKGVLLKYGKNNTNKKYKTNCSIWRILVLCFCLAEKTALGMLRH